MPSWTVPCGAIAPGVLSAVRAGGAVAPGTAGPIVGSGPLDERKPAVRVDTGGGWEDGRKLARVGVGVAGICVSVSSCLTWAERRAAANSRPD